MADEQLICIIPTIKKRKNAYVDQERPLTKRCTVKSVGSEIGGLQIYVEAKTCGNSPLLYDLLKIIRYKVEFAIKKSILLLYKPNVLHFSVA